MSLYADDPDQKLTRKQALRSNDSYIRGGKDRNKMTNKSIRVFRREINERFKYINYSNIRCLKHSMGATWDTKSTGGCWSTVEQSYSVNAKDILTAFLNRHSFAK